MNCRMPISSRKVMSSANWSTAKEFFSRVIRRVLSERPELTAGDRLDAMKAS
jgi:hypothetical protein